MAEFATMAEAIAHVLTHGGTASFTEREAPDPAYLAEIERIRREQRLAYAHASNVWLD